MKKPMCMIVMLLGGVTSEYLYSLMDKQRKICTVSDLLLDCLTS